MSPPSACCNPFNVRNHKCVYKGIREVTKQWGSIYANLLGKHLCGTCRIKIGKQRTSVLFSKPTNKTITVSNCRFDSETTSSSDYEESAYKDSDCQGSCVVFYIPFLIIHLFVDEFLPKCAMKNESEYSRKDLSAAAEIKKALLSENNYKKKLQLLTTVPIDWSAAKIQELLGVTRYMAETAINIRQSFGFGTTPPKKMGRPLSISVVQAVREFYKSDEYSRVMPGKKDYVTVRINGKRENVQKRLLLCNLKDLYHSFLVKHPDLKISLSKFTKLRPASCVVVGCSGSHNVCVCKIHQNMKLKIYGLNQALREPRNRYSISTFTEGFMCPNPSQSCNLLICSNCRGFSSMAQSLKENFNANEIVEVHFKQWISTDR